MHNLVLHAILWTQKITTKQNLFTKNFAILGTLSNLGDKPSGRWPEVFSRSQQLLRMSVMSSMWRSGGDNCWFAVLRWTWAFKAIFVVSVPILPCLILTFEKRKHNFLLFVEGWAVGARDFESKIFTVFRMYCSRSTWSMWIEWYICIR